MVGKTSQILFKIISLHIPGLVSSTAQNSDLLSARNIHQSLPEGPRPLSSFSNKLSFSSALSSLNRDFYLHNWFTKALRQCIAFYSYHTICIKMTISPLCGSPMTELVGMSCKAGVVPQNSSLSSLFVASGGKIMKAHSNNDSLARRYEL